MVLYLSLYRFYKTMKIFKRLVENLENNALRALRMEIDKIQHYYIVFISKKQFVNSPKISRQIFI